MEWIEGDYQVSTDPARLDVEVIHRLLDSSYWAAGRTRETIRKSLEHSLGFGVYYSLAPDASQVGFARVLTDYATIYWLCDVFIDPAHRGHGLGKFLVRCVVTHPELYPLKGLLVTRDAHGLYRSYGFNPVVNPSEYMVRPKPGLFSPGNSSDHGY